MRKVVLSIAVGSALLFAAEPFTKRQREFWSFQPVQEHTPPVVKGSDWVRNPIDQFVLAKLESKAIQPSSAAD